MFGQFVGFVLPETPIAIVASAQKGHFSAPRQSFSTPFLRTIVLTGINSVQTRCIVKGEAQKSPFFWRFSGGFCFSQDRLFSRNSTRKPLNLIKSPIFTNAPCKTACLCNAPSMHTLDGKLIFGIYVAFFPSSKVWGFVSW